VYFVLRPSFPDSRHRQKQQQQQQATNNKNKQRTTSIKQQTTNHKPPTAINKLCFTFMMPASGKATYHDSYHMQKYQRRG